MNSILNIDVSCFRSYYDPINPKEVNLLKWLKSAKYKDEVDKIRTINNKSERDKMKALLPAITPGGVFEKRASSGLVKFSGLLQLDIDLKENEHIQNFNDLKLFITTLPFVAYCGSSVSGLGFWLLIPINNHLLYKEHFLALYEDFKKTTGIIIDKNRKDLAGLRGYSYDADAYFNHSAITYSKTIRSEYINTSPICDNLSRGKYNDVYDFAVRRVEAKGLYFTDGHKHEYIFLLCSILNAYGVSKHDAENWIFSHLPVSPDMIKSNCISSPYQNYRMDFGKKSFINQNE